VEGWHFGTLAFDYKSVPLIMDKSAIAEEFDREARVAARLALTGFALTSPSFSHGGSQRRNGESMTGKFWTWRTLGLARDTENHLLMTESVSPTM